MLRLFRSNAIPTFSLLAGRLTRTCGRIRRARRHACPLTIASPTRSLARRRLNRWKPVMDRWPMRFSLLTIARNVRALLVKLTLRRTKKARRKLECALMVGRAIRRMARIRVLRRRNRRNVRPQLLRTLRRSAMDSTLLLRRVMDGLPGFMRMRRNLTLTSTLLGVVGVRKCKLMRATRLPSWVIRTRWMEWKRKHGRTTSNYSTYRLTVALTGSTVAAATGRAVTCPTFTLSTLDTDTL